MSLDRSHAMGDEERQPLLSEDLDTMDCKEAGTTTISAGRNTSSTETLPLYTPAAIRYRRNSEDDDEDSDRRGQTGFPFWYFVAIYVFIIHFGRRNAHSQPGSESGSLSQTFPSRYDVPDLAPEFVKGCNDLLQTPSGTYTSRLKRLVAALSTPSSSPSDDQPAVWIAEPGTSASYFLGGFAGKDWWLSERPLLVVVTPVHGDKEHAAANITILTAQFEQSRAELVHLPEEILASTTFVPWLESESPYTVLQDYLGGGAKEVILDGQVRSFIQEGLQGVGLDSSSGDSGLAKRQAEVGLIRERKDEREVGLLRCANQMTVHAIRKTRSRMRIGIKESETRGILEEEMANTGIIGGEGLVLFGENAALPHGAGNNRILGKEDMILIDVGGKWGGYVADVTRTFALPESKISKSHIEVWETVRAAQYSVYETLLSPPSVPLHFGSLDAAAREYISSWAGSSRPQPDYSIATTRVGHGIGLDGHESPFLVQGPAGEREVRSGHVFSIEPGVYLPSDGEVEVRGLKGIGVRLEDCFVVTEDADGRLGGEWLSGPVRKWGDI